jgi:CubicO group peptidase (beta-lactamase class C family)
MFRVTSFVCGGLIAGSALFQGCAHANVFDWPEPLSTRAERARNALDGIDVLIEKALIDFNVPGVAVGVVVDGQVVLGKGYGYRDLENKLPLTAQSVMAYGSATKAFTTFLMGMMVEEGLFDWDTRVIDLLPEFRLWDQYATQNLTLRDLVTHRSGMPRHEFVWYNSGLSREEVLARLRFLEPTCNIRERFNYNSLMYMVAGMAMEKVGQKSWEEMTTEKILRPLGMNSTCFSVSEMANAPDAAFPYKEKNGTLVRMKYRDVTQIGPGGSINSNINDMNRWMILLLNNGVYNSVPFLSPATLQEIEAPQVIVSGYPENKEAHLNAYGLGWGIVSYRGHYYVSHDGGIDGFTSAVNLLPQDKVGIVVVANRNLTNLARYLSLELIDRVLELPPKDWIAEGYEQHLKSKRTDQEAAHREDLMRKRNTQPSHELATYAGKYFHPGYGTIVLAVKDGKLHATFNHVTSVLEHWHYDVFSVVSESEEMLISREGVKYTFRNNVNGEIEDLVIPYEPNAPDIVFKKQPDDELSNLAYFRQFTGSYEIYNIVAQVVIRDRALLAIIPGQPVFELMPVSENEFVVKSMTHYMVRFVKDANGVIQEALLILPYGAFSATPVR